MRKPVIIICENTNQKKEYQLGTSLYEIALDQNIKLKYPVLGAFVNNELVEMNYEIFKAKSIRFIDITDRDGMRMYVRSLLFVLMKAVKDLYPDTHIVVEHSISNGYFCELGRYGKEVTPEKIATIKVRMQEIINLDMPFLRKSILNSDAIDIFERENAPEKARLFRQSGLIFTDVHILDNITDFFYGHLIPSTGLIKNFGLEPLEHGMLLRVPKRKTPEELRPVEKQDKLFVVFREHKNRMRILNAQSIARINQHVINKTQGDLIKVAEALHEKRIAEIAETIKNSHTKKLILIAGPSSSGKTTFSKRLQIQLLVSEIKTIQISLDNYFVDREQTPRDEAGDYDFESIHALDINLFNQHINELNQGKEIEMPKFSFGNGERFYDGEKLKIDDNTIIIVEGIHALNPELTKNIDDSIKYKIYISALTQIGIDGHNRIPTTDNRLIRRIIRDAQYRGYSAEDTLKRWQSVRRGEEKNIFPYQENADLMFNSALLYELAVLKKYAVPLLQEIPETKMEHAEASRLLSFLSYFKDIQDDEIPPTSILREFISKSSFSYK